MLDYSKFIARHGEVAAQAIIEYMERHEGVRANVTASLEERWANLMDSHQAEQRLAA